MLEADGVNWEIEGPSKVQPAIAIDYSNPLSSLKLGRSQVYYIYFFVDRTPIKYLRQLYCFIYNVTRSVSEMFHFVGVFRHVALCGYFLPLSREWIYVRDPSAVVD